MHGFLVKYDAAGTALWAHDITTTDENDIARVDVDVDDEGNILVGGDARSAVLVDGSPASGVNGAANAREYFVMKFAPNGSYLWGQHLALQGATGEFNALDVDAAGNVWAVGHDGVQKGHIYKLDGADGSELVHHQTDGASSYINDVKTDAANNAYILGFATNDFTIGGVTCPHNHDLDPSASQWIGKFNAAGDPQWFHVPSQAGSGFAPYPEGNIAVTPDGTVFSDSRKLMRFGNDTISDGSPGKRGLYALDTNGDLLFARKANTTPGLYFNEAVGTADGQAIFLGHFNNNGTSLDLLDTSINIIPGGNTLLLVRYDAAGVLTGLKAGPHITEANGIALDLEGYPVVCGTFSLTPSFDGLTLDGDWDLFALRSELAHTGLAEQGRGDDVIAWPNPAEHMLWIRGVGTDPVTIDVLNAVGQQVLHRDRFVAQREALDLSALPAGALFVRISSPALHAVLRAVHAW
jgi:sugar lactone lactonase YvrE